MGKRGSEYEPQIKWYKCAICKKKFNTYAAYEGWAYMTLDNGKGYKWFCSYGCMREWEKKKDSARKYRTRDTVGI